MATYREDIKAADDALGKSSSMSNVLDWLIANRGYQRGVIHCRLGRSGAKTHLANAVYREDARYGVIVAHANLWCVSSLNHMNADNALHHKEVVADGIGTSVSCARCEKLRKLREHRNQTQAMEDSMYVHDEDIAEGKCADPGKKRRSGGAGRGLGTGDGEGPIGVPVGKKEKGAGMGRRYVRGEDLAKWTDDSMEAQLDLVERTLEMVVEGPVELVATRVDGALFRAPDGTLHEAAFTSAPGLLSDIVVRPSSIQVHDEAALPGLVAAELRDLTGAMLRGEVVERTRVRMLAGLLEKDEPYTLGAVLEQMGRLLAPDSDGSEHWHTMYEANQERIRTAMWGQIRDLEALVPKTAYAKLPRSRLPEFEEELRESLSLLGVAIDNIIDGIRSLVFAGGDDSNGAIRDSLLAEAQTMCGLLAKAGQLVRAEDLERAAEAHDQWCGRARTMEVVAAYLASRSKKGEASA